MKKTHLLFSAIMLTAASIVSHAQPYTWGNTGTGSPTYTVDNVGIGTAGIAIPTDAKLKITNFISCYGGIPEIKVLRGAGDCVGDPPPPTNFFELCTAYGMMAPSLITAFDHHGWLNINPNIGGAPGDARLHIHSTSGTGMTNDPEIKLNRRAYVGGTANYFELWKTVGSSSSHNLVDVINKDGWLGILTPSPTEPLHVEGNARLSGTAWIGLANVTLDVNTGQNVNVGNVLNVMGGLVHISAPGDGVRTIVANSSTNSLNILSGHHGTDGAWIGLHSSGDVDPGTMSFHSMRNGDFNFWNWNGSGFTTLMKIQDDGKVSIGSGIIGSTPGDYRLYVERGILTERVKVAISSSSNWSDFVFNTDYKLMPLAEVEEYVKENKHLPEIPSADEVVKDGIDLATIDAKLLQKIEELTLYVIQQQKEIQNQKHEIELLKKKVN